MQLVDPGANWKLPGSQTVQTPAPALENFPSGQAVHAEDRADPVWPTNNPAAHWTQTGELL